MSNYAERLDALLSYIEAASRPDAPPRLEDIHGWAGDARELLAEWQAKEKGKRDAG